MSASNLSRATADSPLLEVEELSVRFETLSRAVQAVDGMSFAVDRGETVAIVGESGCGKSVTALAILRLLPIPPARIVSGQVRFEGRELQALAETELEKIRGRDIAYIFQEPMTSLNPSMQIGRQIGESLERHLGLSRTAALNRAAALLDLVRIPEARQRLAAYPHQLSGGMRQRVMIAMALACDPKVLIADEPTTALDVTIQAQILSLLSDLQRDLGTGLVLITHDLGVVSETADRVVVMYAGRKVEEGAVDEVLRHPRHPYTRGLIDAVPRLGASLDESSGAELAEIPGLVPALDRPIVGCPFAPRCGYAMERCMSEAPALEAVSPGHATACFAWCRLESLV